MFSKDKDLDLVRRVAESRHDQLAWLLAEQEKSEEG